MTVIMLFPIFNRWRWMQRRYPNVGLSRQHLNATRLKVTKNLSCVILYNDVVAQVEIWS